MRNATQALINRIMAEDSENEAVLSDRQHSSHNFIANNQLNRSQLRDPHPQLAQDSASVQNPSSNASVTHPQQDLSALTNIFADNAFAYTGSMAAHLDEVSRMYLENRQHNNNFLSVGQLMENSNSRAYGSEFDREEDYYGSEQSEQSSQRQRRTSSQDRNFVESIVDNILARHPQNQQMQLAFHLAQLQQQQLRNDQSGIDAYMINDSLTLARRRAYDPMHPDSNLYSHYSERVENEEDYQSDDPNERMRVLINDHSDDYGQEGDGSEGQEDHSNPDDDDFENNNQILMRYQQMREEAEREEDNSERGIIEEEEEEESANNEYDEEVSQGDSSSDEEDVDEDDNGEESEEFKEEENELDKYLRNVNGIARAKTAPLKPQKHPEQFKQTPGFSQLEQAAVCAVQLVQRGDMKFDLDSYEGQTSCKKFLSHIEKLCESVEAQCSNRTYRKKFSNAYKVLYKDGKLCYLTEILDSAQEAFPYLWVNGEKYVFSKEVIDAGRNLFNNFCKILYQIKDAYQRICEEQSYEALIDIITEVREALEEFDLNWVNYEQLYVIELMLIESDARMFITEAIELEKDIASAEVRERAKGKIMVDCPDYNKNRTKLIEYINKINAVANPEGKGRDDLQAEILFQAEGLCRRISSSQSKAVRKLAEAIRKSFQNIRQLFRKYEENIEGVDPQLKNNADLVQALVEFEQSWEKGKSYFVNAQKCSQLLHFTSMIEGTAEKYKSFSEQIDDRDTVIFVTIPALVILKNLDDDDKGICKTFFPPMFGEEPSDQQNQNPTQQPHQKYLLMKENYLTLRSKSKNSYDFYNIVEKAVLEMEGEESTVISTDLLQSSNLSQDDLHGLVQQIRLLAMQLQRHRPAEWNEFLDVALDN